MADDIDQELERLKTFNRERGHLAYEIWGFVNAWADEKLSAETIKTRVIEVAAEYTAKVAKLEEDLRRE